MMKMKKSEIDNKIKKMDEKILSLVETRNALIDKRLEVYRATYTTKQAISLMKEGKKMVRGLGFLHNGGYFFTFENGKFITYNGDGSIYCRDYAKDNLDFESKKGKKFWIILQKNDFIRGYMLDQNILEKRYFN